MSQLLAELPDGERERVRHVLDGCASFELTPGVAVNSATLPAAVFLLVEHGVALLAAGTRRTRRRVLVALASSGGALLPPGDDEELRGLTPVRLTAVSGDAHRRLLREPGAARAIALVLV